MDKNIKKAIKVFPTQEEFVNKNKGYSGEQNAKLIYNLLVKFGEFPDTYDGQTVNNFLNSINSFNMNSLLEEIKNNSISQKRQFTISIVVSIVAMITAIVSLYITFK